MTPELRSGLDRRRNQRPQQDRLRSIVEQMADGIVIVDLAGTIRFANPAAERLFGRPLSQLAGTDLGTPAIAGDMAEIEVVRSGGQAISVELRVVDTDWEGERARLASLRDVTDRKHAEEQAAQLEGERIARAKAEAASRAKSDFLMMMSHELRTPLNAIIGFAEVLGLDIAGPLTAEQRHHVSRIGTGGRHLLRLVNEVLDLATVEAGQLTIQPGVARIGATIDGALALIDSLAESRGVQLIDGCLDESGRAYEADEDRVRQILLCLLNNAVKFTPAGGKIAVECGYTTLPDFTPQPGAGDAWVYARVCDTGVGIPPDQMSAIFDPFVQVMTGHNRPTDGSGLGLTVSLRLARLMKGDLTVKSEVGQGSAFTLWLPAATVGAEADGGSDVAAEGAPPPMHGAASIGEALLRELDPLLDVFVSRLRREKIVPGVDSLRSSQLADHFGTYIADLAAVLIAIDDLGGQPSELVTDGTDIQRLVAERHGAQRARLGWTTETLHREWRVLSEEIEVAVRRRSVGASAEARREALAMVQRLMDQGEDLSCRALSRTLQASG